MPKRGCDPGRTDASSLVIIPQIVRHPFLARCQWLQSRLQDRIYVNGPCMLFALYQNATRLCSGGCHLRSPDFFVTKTKLSLVLRLPYALACIRLVHVAVLFWDIFLTFIGWITGSRYTLRYVSGITPLWKVFHRFCSSSVGSAEGTTVVLFRSVSLCGSLGGC